jgi:hypothetical protein
VGSSDKRSLSEPTKVGELSGENLGAEAPIWLNATNWGEWARIVVAG